MPSDKILISPLGSSPGVIFSAVLQTRARFGDVGDVVAITSHYVSHTLRAALRAAEHDGESYYVIVKDPLGGFSEIPRVVDKVAKLVLPRLAEAEPVVCLTGGTTLLGIIAGEVAARLGALRLCLVDRRPIDDQRKSPYVAGEAYWLPRLFSWESAE